MAETPGLQILISSGPEEAARATLGFELAAAATAYGTPVVLFLAQNGARWALRSEGNDPAGTGQQPIAQLIEIVLAAGGRIEVCSNCVEGVCGSEQNLLMRSERRPGIVTGGLAAVAARLAHSSIVTF